MNKNISDGLVVAGVAVFLYIMYRYATKEEAPEKK